MTLDKFNQSYIKLDNLGEDEKTTDEWKKNNLLGIKTRLKGWQLESFKESYKHKVKSGISLFKKQNLK